jgi:hypothetical protein
VRVDFTRAGSFFAAPFPSDDLRGADGHIALDLFPNDRDIDLVRQSAALVARDARGFSLAGGIFFALTDRLDTKALPSPAGSREVASPVFLVAVDRDSPDFGRRRPIDVTFSEDGGPFGAPNLLALLPVQGIPLRPRTTYAAVVTRSLRDVAGAKLGVALPTAQLLAGTKPAGLSDAAFATYRRAIEALHAQDVDDAEIAGLAVFTTDDPAAQLRRFVDAALARPALAPGPLLDGEQFDDFCVFHTTVRMPVYQRGAPPYAETGGDFEEDAAGQPVFQREEEANLVITIPRRPMPEKGFPTAVFVRTGGGGDRPLVDRGVRATNGGPAIAPGTGPAREFARAGFAGVSVDGPLGGRRNTTGGDEQFLIFNVLNGAALRDNVRQSALELALLPRLLATLTFNGAHCPGFESARELGRFDTDHLALMGHSMGASIAPLTLAMASGYGATVLSGAGASWIENVVFKQKPVAVRPFAETLFRYTDEGRALTAHDPVLTLVQWAIEPADAQVYARTLLREPPPGETPRQVLMLQGIVDHYILPNIANSLSVALGLALDGPALDAAANLPDERNFTDVLALDDPFAPPAGLVRAVTQHPADGIEDGHEVAFQTEAPKALYRCFLKTFAEGAPRIHCGE